MGLHKRSSKREVYRDTIIPQEAKKENYIDEHRCRNPQQNSSRQNPTHIKKIIYHD